jgi:KUP system potassium uptake protein
VDVLGHLGHYGELPIRAAWFAFVLPALVLNHYGQGVLLPTDPRAIQSLFYPPEPS